MFAAGLVTRVAYIASSIARFVALEVIELLCATLRHRAMVTSPRIVAVIDVAVETGAPVKPGTCADKDAAVVPVWAVVVSVLGTCFTKQTGDMVYTMAENSWLSQLWLDARRCVYALERDSNRGPTPAVFIELSEGRDVRHRSVP